MILTNTASLYSSVTYGRGIANDSQFLDRALSCIRDFMCDDGQEFLYRGLIAPATQSIAFSKALNRSVTGSISDLIFHAQIWLTESDLSPHDTGFKLNDPPMSMLDYRNPRGALKSLTIERAGAAGDDS